MKRMKAEDLEDALVDEAVRIAEERAKKGQ